MKSRRYYEYPSRDSHSVLILQLFTILLHLSAHVCRILIVWVTNKAAQLCVLEATLSCVGKSIASVCSIRHLVHPFLRHLIMFDNRVECI